MSFSVTTEPIQDRQLAVTIQVDQERVDRELRKAANRIASQYRIPGFRKGKAPYHIIVQQFGLVNLYNEFVEQLGQELFQQAIEQEGIEPYAQSSLEDIALDPLTYKLIVPLEPQVTLGDYRSLRLEEVSAEPEESDIQDRLGALQEQYASWQDVDRPATYGDMMTIDLRSVIPPSEPDGEETVVLDETGWEVTPDLENPMEPPGIEEHLVGLTAGETLEFDLGWPENSQSIYAGKQAHFTVKVNRVQSYELPELNDDFAKLIGPEFETMDDLIRNIRETEANLSKSRNDQEFINQTLDAVVEMSTLDYPPVMVEDQINGMVQETEQRLRQMGIDDFDVYLRQIGQTLEEYRERLRPEATRIARRNLVLSEVVKAEKLTVTDDEIEARIRDMVGDNSPEEPEEAEEMGSAHLLANLLRQGPGRNMIVSQLLVDKAFDRLTRIARGETIEDPTPAEPETETDQASVAETTVAETAGAESTAETAASGEADPSARTEE